MNLSNPCESNGGAMLIDRTEKKVVSEIKELRALKERSTAILLSPFSASRSICIIRNVKKFQGLYVLEFVKD